MISTPFSDEDDEESRPFSRDQRIVGVGSPTPRHSNNASSPSITLMQTYIVKVAGGSFEWHLTPHMTLSIETCIRRTACIKRTTFPEGVRLIQVSLYVSGKLPTYPFPKPTFCPKWEVSVNVDEREGEGEGASRGEPWEPCWDRVEKVFIFLLKGATSRYLSKPKSKEI